MHWFGLNEVLTIGETIFEQLNAASDFGGIDIKCYELFLTLSINLSITPPHQLGLRIKCWQN